MTYTEADLAPLPRACTQAGCHRLTTDRDGRCEYHPRPRREIQRRADAKRGTAPERGYDWSWRRLRQAYIRDHPLCKHCLEIGRVTAAEEIDHIVPLRQGGARLNRANLQALCRSHHRAKTHRDTANR